MKIAVLGAGIVGMMTAYWLVRDGHSVTLFDSAASVGTGASFGNGGQLSYSYVAPLASPGLFASLPKWLLDPGSPIRFRPAWDPAQWRWLAAFLAACNTNRATVTTRRLLALAELSRASLHRLVEETPVAFDYRANGKLVVYSDDAGFAAAAAQQRLQADLGSAQEVLDATGCIAREPSLRAIAGRLRGGILTPSEEVGNSRLLCVALQAVLAAPPYNVAFRLGQPIALRRREAGLTAIAVGDQTMVHDLSILCTGADSAALAASIGLTLPVYPIKGYSLTAPIIAPEAAPALSVTDYQNKTVYARLGDDLRIAGFAEIVGHDRSLDPRRIRALARATDQTFPGACDTAAATAWAGLRPATPTGVPILGASPFRDLLLNVGHGALGFTLSCGSGRFLADLIAGRRLELDPADFALSARQRPVAPSLAAA